MGMKYAKERFNMGVLQNGYIFISPTHTSRHFYTGVTPPPPGGDLAKCARLYVISSVEDPIAHDMGSR